MVNVFGEDDRYDKAKAGKPGPRGLQGKRGIQGPKGVEGPVGKQGKQGVKGEKGERGETGPKGEQGVKGDRGDVGSKGDRGEKGDRGDTGSKGEPGVRGDTGPKGDKGEKGSTPTDVASKSFVIDMVEAATSLESAFIAKPNKSISIINNGGVLKPWRTVKKDGSIVQTRSNGLFIVSQPSSIATYIHVRSRQDTQATFELYSNSSAKVVQSSMVNLIKNEQLSVLMQHRIEKYEKLSIRVWGLNLNITIDADSRVEVTLLRLWYPPELVAASSKYPWGPGTLYLANDINGYRQIHITAYKDTTFISKTISPMGMIHDSTIDKTWTVNVENSLKLEFSGRSHDVLHISEIASQNQKGYKILSMYGSR